MSGSSAPWLWLLLKQQRGGNILIFENKTNAYVLSGRLRKAISMLPMKSVLLESSEASESDHVTILRLQNLKNLNKKALCGTF